MSTPWNHWPDLDRSTFVEPEQCILIAEDNEADVMALRRAFQQLGYVGLLKVVENGVEAIAYMEGDGKFADRSVYPFPDLLLLDLKMPRTNGFEVLQWLRGRRDEISMLRTVVLTTSDQTKDVNRAYALGANSFLVKPLQFQDFKDCIEAILRYWLNLSYAPAISQESAELVAPVPGVPDSAGSLTVPRRKSSGSRPRPKAASPGRRPA